MSKINIETSIKQNNKIEKTTTQAILQDNIIKYKENNIINILDIEKEKLKRKTNEYEITIDFKNKTIINKYNEYEIPLKIKIINKTIEQNKINIKYQIIDTKDIFEYEIIWR